MEMFVQFERLIMETLNRLLGKSGRHCNTDSLLNELRKLNRAKVAVPMKHLIKGLEILTFRRDVLRTELLLRMSQQNLKRSLVPISDRLRGPKRYGNRSIPVHDEYNKLCSYAICGLIRHGAVDESMQLWVRMSTGNSNYVTNRIALEKIIEKVASGPNSVASMDLIDDMHQMMKSNRWDQKSGGRGHYSAMLRVLRKYLGSYMDGDAYSIEQEAATRFSKLESIWEEVGKSGYLDDDKSSLGIELYAMRLQSLVNLAVAVDDARSHEGTMRKKQKEKDIGSERPADLDLVETIKAELLQLVDLLEESKYNKRRDKVEKRILSLAQGVATRAKGESGETNSGDEGAFEHLQDLFGGNGVKGEAAGGKSIPGAGLIITPILPHRDSHGEREVRETFAAVRAALLFLAGGTQSPHSPVLRTPVLAASEIISIMDRIASSMAFRADNSSSSSSSVLHAWLSHTTAELVQVLSSAQHEEERESSLQAFEAIFAAQSPPLSTVTLRCAYFQGVASSLSDHVLIEALGMALLEDATEAGTGAGTGARTASSSSSGDGTKDTELAYNSVLRALCRDEKEEEEDATAVEMEKGKAQVRAGAGAGFSSEPLDNPREAVKRAHGLVRSPLF